MFQDLPPRILEPNRSGVNDKDFMTKTSKICGRRRPLSYNQQFAQWDATI